MKYKFIALSAVALLALSGCSSTPAAPQATVTVTAEAEPQNTVTSKPKSNTTSVKEDFVSRMDYLGVESWMLTGEALGLLIDMAHTTCEAIDNGSTADDITWMMTVAGQDSSEEVMYASLAAAVVATYTYCPEYEGFFD